jgi:hypothetical protein
MNDKFLLLLSLAPQSSLGLGLLHKIRLNFLEASQQFSFLQGRVVSPTPIPADQACVLYLYPSEAGWLPILVASYDTHLTLHKYERQSSERTLPVKILHCSSP